MVKLSIESVTKLVARVNDKDDYNCLLDAWKVPYISKNPVLCESQFDSTSTECWLQVNNERVLYTSRNKDQGLFKAVITVLANSKKNKKMLM